MAVCIANKAFWVLSIPFAVALILLYIYALDKLMLFIIFATPLAIEYKNPDFQIGFSLPTEPLMFGIMLLFFLRLLYEGKMDKKILKHPITIALIINLVWIFITCLTSTLPLVSFKFLLARLWFVTTFYFYGILLFKKFSNIRKMLWLSIIPLTGVIIYTIIMHAQNGFDEESAHWVMWPFYRDHTVYGAILALFFPAVVGLTFSKATSTISKIGSWCILGVFVVGLILSYTRAAWLGLSISLVVFILLLIKIRFRTILISVATIIVLFFSFKDQLFMKLEKNRQDSSNNLTEHVQSISNISSDASNLERFNRWSCAWRMFKDKPIVGFGPGTYMFKYAPYQFSYEKTIISTNNGDNGNAHSEYIGPLAESGILGSLSFIAIAICIIYTAVKLYMRLQNKDAKMLVMVFLLGLITYFAHGVLNNFLDQDKAAVPFWAFAAAIAAIDIYHSKTKEVIVEE